MRIALIAPFGLQPKGTVSARMVPLAQALARRGHLVRIVIPPWDDPSALRARYAGQRPTSVANVVATEPAPAGVHTVALPLPRRLPNSIALTYGLLREALAPTIAANPPFETDGPVEALRTLTGFRAEVAHVFKPVGYSGLAGFALSLLGVPWLLDVDDWEGAGGWGSANSYSLPERLSIALMESALPRLARGVTAASRTLEARAWDMGLPRERAGYMPNGVWAEKYARWAAYTKQTGPLSWEWSGAVAALRERHGLAAGEGPVVLLYTRFAEFPWQWPLRVLRRVVAEHPRAKLLVVGAGFSREEEKLRREAERVGLGQQVVVTGRVAERLLPAYFSLASVAIYPMADTLLNRAKSPVKVLEPMVAGLPLVAHRVGQAAEFVGRAGLLVPPGDLDGMAAGVLRLLADQRLANLLGAQAQQRVWSRFNWEHLSGVAEGMYEAALAGRPATGD